ncbi:hypothetical protein Taro_014943 [Colocasia esculenta]|uniref:Uncharacterized protein n=1 Tax=Colocasia esculenta TaxID=4460 RepID=A0A843UKW5_COLES|nr:hypothetical protein [Colocasia esculenta]
MKIPAALQDHGDAWFSSQWKEPHLPDLALPKPLILLHGEEAAWVPWKQSGIGDDGERERNERRRMEMEWRREKVERIQNPTRFQEECDRRVDLEKRKEGFTHFCLGSVDTRSKQVDTSPRFQKTQLPDWDIRSTLDQVRSTLVSGSLDTSLRFTHFCLGSVNTRSKQVDTSPRFQKTQLSDWDIRSTLDQVDLSSTGVDTTATEAFFLWTSVDLSGDFVDLVSSSPWFS